MKENFNRVDFQQIIDLMMKGIKENFLADAVTIKKIENKQPKLIIEFKEEETENIYRVIIYKHEKNKETIIDSIVLLIFEPYVIDELYARGYLKFKGLLDVFRDCWFFTSEVEEVII